jgi:WD40 repeat protein
MSPSPLAYEYSVGGCLTVTAPSYVLRQSDRELYTGLKAGEFCYVLNASQMGKSSLRVRTMQRLQAEGIACAAIDMSDMGTEDITPEQWYASVINSIVNSLGLYDCFDLEDWWQKNVSLSNVNRLSQFIEEILLKRVTQPMVIFVDEIGSVLKLPFEIDDFFAVIRGCYNHRADNPIYQNLTFALLGVANSSDLIRDKQRTPFNVGRSIELKGFTLHEAQPLAAGLATKADNPNAVLKEILRWTGGQPFLTQKVCCSIAASPFPIAAGSEVELVNNLIRVEIIENWEAQDDPVHLKAIRNRVLTSGAERVGQLLTLYQQIVEREEIFADDSLEQMELQLSGLVMQSEGKLRVYNPIYAVVFDSQWLEQCLDALRPYAKALKAWEDSDRQDASRLLRGQALSEAQTWAKNKKLGSIDYNFLAAGEELEKRETQRELKIVEYRIKTLGRRGVLGISLLVATAMAIITVQAHQKLMLAQQSEANALQLLSRSLLLSDNQLKSLITGVRSGTILQKLDLQSGKETEETENQLKAVLSNIQEHNRLKAHDAELWSVAVSPNAQIVASAAYDKTIKLWTPQGQLLKSLKGHTKGVVSLSFAPNSKLLASASHDQTLKIWNLETGKALPLNGRHIDGANSVQFSPNGQTLVSGGSDKKIKFWNLKGDNTLTIPGCPENSPSSCLGHHQGIQSVIFSPNGKTIVSAGQDKSIKFWDLKGKRLKQILGCKPQEELKTQQPCPGHNGMVMSLAFSPDGKQLISGSDDTTTKIWKSDGTLIKTLQSQKGTIRSIQFSQDKNSQTFATASDDSTINLWSYDGILLKILKGHVGPVYGVAFTPDSRGLISGGSDKKLRFWHLDQSLIKAVRAHQDGVNSISFSADGQWIASSGGDRTIKLWNRTGTLQPKPLELDRCTPIKNPCLEGMKVIRSVKFASNSKILASANDEGKVKLWNLKGKRIKEWVAHSGHSVFGISFSPDGTVLATSGNDFVKIWKLDGHLIKPFRVEEVRRVRFSPDGQMIATTSKDPIIRLWRRDGTFSKNLIGHVDVVTDVSFSPDGKTLASVGYDNTVRLWSREGKLLNSFEDKTTGQTTAHTDWVQSVSFSPDGKFVVSASNDKTIKLWRINGRLVKTFIGHSSPVFDVKFSPDGQSLASAGVDTTIRIWRIAPEDIQPPTLNGLVEKGCNWLKDYLNASPELTQPELSRPDRKLCSGIHSQT